jgi:hypothetical protein
MAKSARTDPGRRDRSVPCELLVNVGPGQPNSCVRRAVSGNRKPPLADRAGSEGGPSGVSFPLRLGAVHGGETDEPVPPADD